MKEIEFKIFTLNCWGIPVISKDRRDRMEAIAKMLVTSHYDFICLQEVWTTTDFVLIRDKIIGAYPFSHYFYSGVFGSGVCVFSKYTLQDVFFHQWMVNGYVHKLQHGDWLGGKGVGLCCIRVNDYNINVYSAHLHAEYDRTCDEYKAHRVLQAFDTAQFIQLTSAGADLIILGGDLNTEPGDLAYRVLESVTGLCDAFNETTDIAKEVFTNETPNNSYTSKSLIKKKYPGKRIDYIMYSAGSNINVILKKFQHPLPDRVPDCSYSYSDHEAITATLAVNRTTIPHSVRNINARIKVLEECISICDDALNYLICQKRFYWFFTAILFMTLITFIATEAPFNLTILYHILKIVITIIMGYTFIMATLWNMIESNGILSGKLAMQVNLKQCSINQRFDCS